MPSEKTTKTSTKRTATKTTASKTAAKKTATKKTAAKSTAKSTSAKAATTKKIATKKPAAKTSAKTTKVAATKTAAPKAAATKTAATTNASKTPATKKPAPKKSASRKTTKVTSAPAQPAADPVLKVEHLSKEFPVESGVFASRIAKKVSAVDDVSFEIAPGETLGLVGESGCGKSTTGRAIMRLTKPSGGRVLFQGEDIASMLGKRLKKMRHDMQFIFQDPYASLNPRMTIGEIVSEPLVIHNEMTNRQERIEYVRHLLDVVGLNPEHINRYPHEFSGGQRQRVGIARAFALHPRLIICDEPVSALDVSIQAQVLNLLARLQKEFGTAYLFIAHDLSVVQHISAKVAVMYLGTLVEQSDYLGLYAEPYHPYTQALLSAIPLPNPDLQKKRNRIILQGDPPSPADPPKGCRFHTRCPIATEQCKKERPPMEEVAKDHYCACWHAEPYPIKGSNIAL